MADSTLTGTLADRPAAYGVIQECLALQSTAPQRSPIARFLGTNPLHPEAFSWFQGAIGERQIGRMLAALGPEWSVLHSVPVGSGMSDIDHVVVGPMSVKGPGAPTDVTVLCDRELVPWLKRRVPVLDESARLELVDAAANPRTWHVTADAAVDPDAVARFDSLRSGVLAAARQRTMMAMGLALGLSGVLLLTLTQLVG